MFKEGLIGLVIFMCLIELYLYFAFKKHIKNKFIIWGSVFITVSVIAFLSYNFIYFDRSIGQTPKFMWSVGFLLLVGIPKLIFVFFYLFEDLFRIPIGIYNRIFNNPSIEYIPARRKAIFQLAMGIAAIPVAALLHGMTLGKYNYKVIKEKLRFKRLPKSFAELKIAHITDIHSGSLDQKDKIENAIELLNQQDFDILFFTGDIVNNFHWEMDDWYEVFNKIKKAPMGNFAVLGNHDYGEYSEWKSEELKKDNFEKIKAIFPKIGFDLLLNENRILERNSEKIAIVGVENWGINFKRAGDLSKASEGLNSDIFKIVLSHDPTHWEEIIKKDSLNYDLTLAGHTHGLQMGIEVPFIGLKWSPAKYMYKQWAGLYHYDNKTINVNRGFGYHFYPGRTGIWPEITIIELHN